MAAAPSAVAGYPEPVGCADVVAEGADNGVATAVEAGGDIGSADGLDSTGDDVGEGEADVTVGTGGRRAFVASPPQPDTIMHVATPAKISPRDMATG